MSQPARLFLAAHGTLLFAGVWSGIVALSWLLGYRVIGLDFVGRGLPRPVPTWELTSVALASLAPSLLAPRLRSWETHLVRTSLRAMSSLLALAAICSVGSVSWLMHKTKLPQSVPWTDSARNAILICAVAFVLSNFLGPRLGGVLALTAYALLATAQQAWPQASSWLLLAGARGAQPPLWPCALAVPVAVMLAVLSPGGTDRSAHLTRYDYG